MEYRIVSVIMDENGCVIEEGESVKITLDDGCVIVGVLDDLSIGDNTIDVECEYFTINIDFHRITNITTE